MKIGIDIRVLMDKRYSGVSEYAANLLTAILNLDAYNEYRLFYNSYHNLDAKLAKWQRPNSKVIGRHIPNKAFNYIFQKLLAWPKLDLLLGGVEVFWSPHFNFSCLSGKTKKIITVHDLSFLRYPEFFNWRQNAWHRLLGVKRQLLASNLIVAVSENTKNDIVELLGIEADKIKVIYSGNNLAYRDISESEINGLFERSEISDIPRDAGFILYLGNIEPRKNICAIISAYNILRQSSPIYDNLRLFIAGAKGWRNRELYREYRRSPFRGDIRFLGYVSREEKEVLYARASVFVYPSLYEGFGFPPLEAMAFRCPVVCSNISSLPEVVGDAALMVNPFRAEEIKMAISNILEDKALRSDLINKGTERARLFSWEKAAGEYLKLWSEK